MSLDSQFAGSPIRKRTLRENLRSFMASMRLEEMVRLGERDPNPGRGVRIEGLVEKIEQQGGPVALAQM